MKVNFVYKNGRERAMDERYAKILTGLNMGTYLTRDVVAARIVPVAVAAEFGGANESQDVGEHRVEEQSSDDTSASVDDGLDGLEAEELRALAKERGVKVHHAAGADKIRAALRGAIE